MKEGAVSFVKAFEKCYCYIILLSFLLKEFCQGVNSLAPKNSRQPFNSVCYVNTHHALPSILRYLFTTRR